MTRGDEFVPIARVKYVLPALVAVVCALTACKTTADRFDLFAPDKPQGPYLQKLRGMTLAGRYDHQSNTYTVPVGATAAPLPPSPGGEQAIPLVLPPAVTPETNVGAPAPTPFPQGAPAMIPVPITPPAGALPAAPAPAPAAGAESTIPGLTNPAVPPSASAPAPAAASSPAPVIPGLSQ